MQVTKKYGKAVKSNKAECPNGKEGWDIMMEREMERCGMKEEEYMREKSQNIRSNIFTHVLEVVYDSGGIHQHRESTKIYRVCLTQH